MNESETPPVPTSPKCLQTIRERIKFKKIHKRGDLVRACGIGNRFAQQIMTAEPTRMDLANLDKLLDGLGLEIRPKQRREPLAKPN